MLFKKFLTVRFSCSSKLEISQIFQFFEHLLFFFWILRSDWNELARACTRKALCFSVHVRPSKSFQNHRKISWNLLIFGNVWFPSWEKSQRVLARFPWSLKMSYIWFCFILILPKFIFEVYYKTSWILFKKMYRLSWSRFEDCIKCVLLQAADVTNFHSAVDQRRSLLR